MWMRIISLIILEVITLKAYGQECIKYNEVQNVNIGVISLYKEKGILNYSIKIKDLSKEEINSIINEAKNKSFDYCTREKYHRFYINFYGDMSYNFRGVNIKSENNIIYLNNKKISEPMKMEDFNNITSEKLNFYKNEIGYEYYITKEGKIIKEDIPMHPNPLN